MMKTDIEIAQECTMEPITEVAERAGIPEEYLEQYGKYKAKIDYNFLKKSDKKDGKLILVTAINPTPAGEGKTTTTVGLADALQRMGKKPVVALREPSLGPVFGMKGGAAGGGYAQVVPMEDINLHFTGDFHAITSANNLLAAMLDNHIHQGNALGIDTKRIVWKRCMDMNDRTLRNIVIGLGDKPNGVTREDHFIITVASEIMAILCLAEDMKDLKERIDKIIVAYNYAGDPVTAKDLKATGAMAALLKDAIKPNLVQTLEHTPALIHGGPFANIAHGCNSIRATKLALKLSDYTITESGFGADLGAEKFLDIKCKKFGIKPDAVVLVTTIKALKYHGGVEKENIQKENIEAIKNGLHNLYKHIDNIKNKFGLNVIVALNKYYTDTKEEIDFLTQKLKEKQIEISIVEGWEKGGEGAIDIANKIVELANKNSNLNYMYELEDDIKTKILKVSTKIYGAKNVIYSKEAEEQIEKINLFGYSNLPICIAKTQYSFSDDPKNLECKNDYSINVKSVELKAGAGFIVVIAGNIMTMPGLPKMPAAENIDIDKDGNIIGLF